ncbi:Uncharacterised protein [uncultured archaeon]|nr:Uncharacterised protein [uncultured archaeon]
MAADKAEELVKMKLRTKLSYYVSPLWLKIIMVLIILLLVGGSNIHA